eukprot:TRINITY_DN793_c0_g3_i1.p1 TRINITY_DN793_c0_g3~~TRINITY_DN793_c0_g3_i1.p1  ORF type:complete len:1215 (-),score=342.83 TRINITY_DN793_c0_g3_i1:36-3680(-)
MQHAGDEQGRASPLAWSPSPSPPPSPLSGKRGQRPSPGSSPSPHRDDAEHTPEKLQRRSSSNSSCTPDHLTDTQRGVYEWLLSFNAGGTSADTLAPEPAAAVAERERAEQNEDRASAGFSDEDGYMEKEKEKVKEIEREREKEKEENEKADRTLANPEQKQQQPKVASAKRQKDTVHHEDEASGDGAPPPLKRQKTAAVFSKAEEEQLALLCEMGIDRELVVAALEQCPTLEEVVNKLISRDQPPKEEKRKESHAIVPPPMSTTATAAESSVNLRSATLSPLKAQLLDVKAVPAAPAELCKLKDEPLVLSPPSVTPVVKVPFEISSKLMDFQRDGIKFLYSLYERQMGGILADDMGLGKTVQTIGFVASLFGDIVIPFFKIPSSKDAPQQPKPAGMTPHVLIVAPASVLENWQNEFYKWAKIRVEPLLGSEKAKDELLKKAKKGKVKVMIAGYETFRSRIEDVKQIDWNCIIFDEVHKVKNKGSLVAKSCKNLPTTRRFGLTGTVMQNNFEELWTLIDFTSPGYLGSLDEFRRTYVNPIKTGQRRGALLSDVGRARSCSSELSRKLRHIVLRRDKSVISEMLPGKEDNIVFCKLTDLQTRCYQRALASPVYEELCNRFTRCACGSGIPCDQCPCQGLRDTLKPDAVDWRKEIFRAITNLQKIANHLSLLNSVPADTQEKQARDQEFRQCVLAEDLAQVDECEARGSCDALCGKMKALRCLFATWQEHKKKVLLFSHSTRTMDLLEVFLTGEKISYDRLDGTTPVSCRQRIVSHFERSPSTSTLLASVKVGGLGLNITAASVVVVFEPNWNPSHDLQAQDRAYRIGQSQYTTVYRFVSAGTIEEVTYDRQIYKQQMAGIVLEAQTAKRYFRGVAGVKGQEGELFGLVNLLRFNPTDSVLTNEIIERSEKAEEHYRITKALCNGDEENSAIRRLFDGQHDEGNSDAAPPPAPSPFPPFLDDAPSALAAASAATAAAASSAASSAISPITSPPPPLQLSAVDDEVTRRLRESGVVYSHKFTDVVRESEAERAFLRNLPPTDVVDDYEEQASAAAAAAAVASAQAQKTTAAIPGPAGMRGRSHTRNLVIGAPPAQMQQDQKDSNGGGNSVVVKSLLGKSLSSYSSRPTLQRRPSDEQAAQCSAWRPRPRDEDDELDEVVDDAVQQKQRAVPFLHTLRIPGIGKGRSANANASSSAGATAAAGTSPTRKLLYKSRNPLH